MKAQKPIVLSVSVMDESSWNLPTNLDEFIDMLNSKRESIPPEFRSSAQIEIEIDSHYGECVATLSIWHEPPIEEK